MDLNVLWLWKGFRQPEVEAKSKAVSVAASSESSGV